VSFFEGEREGGKDRGWEGVLKEREREKWRGERGWRREEGDVDVGVDI